MNRRDAMRNNNGQHEEEQEVTPCWLARWTGITMAENEKGQSDLGVYIYLETKTFPKVHSLAMLALANACENLNAVTNEAQGTDYQRHLEDLSAALTEVLAQQLIAFTKRFREVALAALGPEQLE
jgi:hypothetical protein